MIGVPPTWGGEEGAGSGLEKEVWEPGSLGSLPLSGPSPVRGIQQSHVLGMAGLEGSWKQASRARAGTRAWCRLQGGSEGCDHRVGGPVRPRQGWVEAAAQKHQLVACALAPCCLCCGEPAPEQALCRVGEEVGVRHGPRATAPSLPPSLYPSTCLLLYLSPSVHSHAPLCLCPFFHLFIYWAIHPSISLSSHPLLPPPVPPCNHFSLYLSLSLPIPPPTHTFLPTSLHFPVPAPHPPLPSPVSGGDGNASWFLITKWSAGSRMS